MQSGSRTDVVGGTAPVETMRPIVAAQIRAVAGADERLDCAGCERSIALKLAYRCFECGAWFCSACGAAHWPDAAARRAARAARAAGSAP